MDARTFQLKRFCSRPEAGGETLFFRAMDGDRTHPMPFFRPEEVPPFEGEVAWFLAERVPRRGWRIVKRIHPYGEPSTAAVDWIRESARRTSDV